MSAIRVLLVDDQSLFRAGMRKLLSGQADIEVVGEAANGEEALQRAISLVPQVILMDVRMPVLDGVEATRRLQQVQPASRVILLTTFDDDEYIFEGLRSGALGYLLKDADLEDVTRAIRAATGGGAILTPSVAARVVAEFARLSEYVPLRPRVRVEPLTLREHAVLELAARTCSNREIGDRLGIAELTVKKHMTSILEKLDVTERTQAVIRAREIGLL